ncbi:MAG: transketolase C-terminal domain-containing protein [Bacillota bacterium]
MISKPTAMLLTGNHAVSYGAMLARPKVIPIYPITPQTPIAEKLTELQLSGALEAETMTPESEHSAMAACITASLAGVRVFTATASQGLMLMHEMLHYASGARAPIVMANVNRTIGSPWGFWPDQTDSLAQRDTGWIHYYTESAQESLDTVLQAYRTAEQVSLPAMVIHEAFYVSHSLEVVEVPSHAMVDSYLPPFTPEIMLDPSINRSWGNVVNQEMFWRHRKYLGEAMEQTLEVAAKADAQWKELTGRGYELVEAYRCADAEVIIVTMGSMAGTTREAVDMMRARGLAAGLLKVRLFRPFPVQKLQSLLKGVPRVMIMDRNFSPGLGGVLHQEVKAALYGMKKAPPLYGYLVGVGGLNVSPALIEKLVRRTLREKAEINSIWVGE